MSVYELSIIPPNVFGELHRLPMVTMMNMVTPNMLTMVTNAFVAGFARIQTKRVAGFARIQPK